VMLDEASNARMDAWVRQVEQAIQKVKRGGGSLIAYGYA
jgi:hypothetical protein